MALEDIFKALEEQADEECEQILAGARAQADAITDEAREQAAEVKQAHVDAAEREVRSAAAQKLNAARLASRRGVAAVKDRGIAAAFDGAGTELAKLRGTSAYGDVFKRLAEEAAAGITGDIEVLVDPADAQLADQTMRGLGVQAVVKPDIETTGGLVLSTSGGTIFRKNTFEDRLERLKESGQAEVAEILLA